MGFVASIDDSLQVTAGNAGTLQALFQAPNAGTVAVVAINVPNAEATASWGAFLGPVPGRIVASWGGNTPCSALREPAEQQLTVTGAALTPGKAYTINRIGYVLDDDGGPLLLPTPPPPGGAVLTPPPTPVPGGTSSGGGTGPPSPPAPPAPVLVTVVPAKPTAITSILTVIVAMTGGIDDFVDFPLLIGLIVLADENNAHPVYVGGASTTPDPVSTNSFKLEPGVGISFPVANANIIGALGTAGDIVSIWGS